MTQSSVVQCFTLDHDPVICGLVPYLYTVTQWSVVQIYTMTQWSAVQCFTLDHDPVICGLVPYP